MLEEVWWGRGKHFAVVLHRKETLVYACVTQEQRSRVCRYGWKDFGDTVGVRNSEEKKGSRARRNQGLVRVENVANMALCLVCMV